MGMGGGTVRPPVMRVGATVRAPPGSSISLCPEPGAFLASQLYLVPGPTNLGLCPAWPKGRAHDAV